ncbi:MAG: TlpA family protein disulfide reductase [Dehalococcoidia bacterium]
MKPPVSFRLSDDQGVVHSFPNQRPTLLVFVKEDCATCNLTLPLLEAVHRAADGGLEVLTVAQISGDIPVLRERHALTMPMLDDGDLDLSYEADIDTVPSLFLYDGDGACTLQTYGFDKAEWQELAKEALTLAGKPAAQLSIDWGALPAVRPGCGAKNVEPGVAEKLEARKSGGLMARVIEIGRYDDVHEFLFDQGFTDGLPVVPPTPERVWRMLKGTRRDPQEVVAEVPPNIAPVTVEKVAINAVMAGAKPEYLPLILAAVEAACTDEFNIHGVLATTHYAGPVVIVNGPVRHALGMNMRMNVLGQGNRANASIGRALQLVIRNIGGGRPGDVDRAMQGGPHKYTFCFPEYEERSPWEPLHVERGFAPDDSTVTLFAGSGPQPVFDQLSRDARGIATSLAWSLDAVSHVKHHGAGEVFVVLSPEHLDTIVESGWSKDDIREQIQLVTARPLRELLRNEENAEGIPPERAGDDLERLLPKFRDPSMINIVVAGGEAGKFSAILGGWVSGPMGSISVTRKISE